MFNPNFPTHREALDILRTELAGFNVDALNTLLDDARAGRVGTTWSDCPLSYRRGARGSIRCDIQGNGGNDFTVAWDSGIIGVAALEVEVIRELKARAPRVQEETHV